MRLKLIYSFICPLKVETEKSTIKKMYAVHFTFFFLSLVEFCISTKRFNNILGSFVANNTICQLNSYMKKRARIITIDDKKKRLSRKDFFLNDSKIRILEIEN